MKSRMPITHLRIIFWTILAKLYGNIRVCFDQYWFLRSDEFWSLWFESLKKGKNRPKFFSQKDPVSTSNDLKARNDVSYVNWLNLVYNPIFNFMTFFGKYFLFLFNILSLFQMHSFLSPQQ